VTYRNISDQLCFILKTTSSRQQCIGYSKQLKDTGICAQFDGIQVIVWHIIKCPNQCAELAKIACRISGSLTQNFHLCTNSMDPR